jgi:hypothetical protein
MRNGLLRLCCLYQWKASGKTGCHADRLLDDPDLVEIVHQVLLKRWPKSRGALSGPGRLSTPAEVVLRLLVLKHVRNWSYGVLAREVRANLVCPQFTRIGLHRGPHAKTIGKLELVLGPSVVQQLHRNIVAQAQAEKVIPGQKPRSADGSAARKRIASGTRFLATAIWNSISMNTQLALISPWRSGRPLVPH